jgi:glycosyltransferase involved in cell wall biosynthesis
LVEAASCGRAIVAADIPGVRESFVPDSSILLADPREPATLTTALARLCDDPLLRETLGKEALAEYESRYTLDVFWRGIDAALDELRT